MHTVLDPALASRLNANLSLPSPNRTVALLTDPTMMPDHAPPAIIMPRTNLLSQLLLHLTPSLLALVMDLLLRSSLLLLLFLHLGLLLLPIHHAQTHQIALLPILRQGHHCLSREWMITRPNRLLSLPFLTLEVEVNRSKPPWRTKPELNPLPSSVIEIVLCFVGTGVNKPCPTSNMFYAARYLKPPLVSLTTWGKFACALPHGTTHKGAALAFLKGSLDLLISPSNPLMTSQ